MLKIVGVTHDARAPQIVQKVIDFCDALPDGEAWPTAELCCKLECCRQSIQEAAKHPALAKYRITDYLFARRARGTVWANEKTVRKYYADQDRKET